MTTDDFRPKASSRFAPGALGEPDGGGYRNTILEEFRLDTGTPCLLARPHGTVRAAVVLAPSLRGHNGMFTELCLRLAQRHGWAVASPDFLPSLQGYSDEERSRSMAGVADSVVLKDLKLAADTLRASRVALIGFCCGGMYAFKASASSHFSAVVSFYGMVRLPPEWRGDTSAEPLSCLQLRIVPVLAIFGGRDPLVAREEAVAVEGLGIRTLALRDAGHAFAHDPSLGSYRSDDARIAWRAAADFIREHL
jgi:dienelactone hydrolase